MYRRVISIAFSMLVGGLQSASASTPPDSLSEIRRQITILTEEIERLKLGIVNESTQISVTGLGPAASKVYSLRKTGVSIAGYGELVYENIARTRDDGSTATSLDKVDFLRNVMYVGYRFNDLVVFNSEVEFEHASTGKGGEVSVELATIDLLLSPRLNVRAGMLLAPVGIINEKHEPPTFFGTLRPNVERIIIPSTWRMNGAGIYGEAIEGLHYRAYVVEGLTMSKFSASDGVRGGRQSGASAVAEDLGFTGRLEYTDFSWGTVGASFFTGNSGQSEKDSLGSVINARTTVFSVHGDLTWKGLEVRGLFGQTSVDEANRVSGYLRWKARSSTAPIIGSVMVGWYLSVGYDIMPHLVPGSTQSVSPFTLYESINTHASVPSGQIASAANNRSTLVYGVTWKPHPNVAFKADVRDNRNGAGTGTNQWNLAVTYLY